MKLSPRRGSRYQPLPALAFLKECFQLKEPDGILVWKRRPREHFVTDFAWKTFNTKWCGKSAGTVYIAAGRKSGAKYLRVMLLKRQWYSHRIIYYLRTGIDPLDNQVDHEDGDGLNNRRRNHRLADNETNCRNQSISNNNTSGKLGVFKRRTGWVVYIGSEYVGHFKQFTKAVTARSEAAKARGYHTSHGRAKELVK